MPAAIITATAAPETRMASSTRATALACGLGRTTVEKTTPAETPADSTTATTESTVAK